MHRFRHVFPALILTLAAAPPLLAAGDGIDVEALRPGLVTSYRDHSGVEILRLEPTIALALKAGEVTDVIRTKQGFVILKVVEHQAAGVPTLKDVEPRIQDAIYMQKLQPALRVYLTKLREEAYIDIKPGYVDSGASANQTKPVETTARDVTAKKLKKKKKLGVF